MNLYQRIYKYFTKRRKQVDFPVTIEGDQQKIKFNTYNSKISIETRNE
jgi:hypothetical protein